jgi:hypothetical protein
MLNPYKNLSAELNAKSLTHPYNIRAHYTSELNPWLETDHLGGLGKLSAHDSLLNTENIPEY